MAFIKICDQIKSVSLYMIEFSVLVIWWRTIYILSSEQEKLIMFTQPRINPNQISQ